MEIIKYSIFTLLLLSNLSVLAQTENTQKYYIGASYGRSFTLGDFKDTDITNSDAGFAKNGNKLDFFGGYLLSDRITITGTLRYQNYETDVSDIVDSFNANNPDATFVGEMDNWNTFYVLVGAAYKIPISQKFAFYPRFGLGPLWAKNPGATIQVTQGISQNNFSRSRETGVGLGYELGIGFRNDFGKHFSLMPTFTFSGGLVTFNDIVTEVNNVSTTSDYDARIQSFNLGLSLAYRF